MSKENNNSPLKKGLLSPHQWLYASLMFVVGLCMLYDLYLGNTISMWIMTPIVILGIGNMFLFMRSLQKEQELEKLS